MATYTLDCSTWRSGGEGKFTLGKGQTHLLNNEGYSCCLGQFALQVGVDKDLLLNVGCPDDVMTDQSYDEAFQVVLVEEGEDVERRDTLLALDLMRANDNGDLTLDGRISRISELLEKYGHELVVINRDKVD